ncbi:putative cytosol aminopeptidase [Acidisoma sp. 7E03]
MQIRPLLRLIGAADLAGQSLRVLPVMQGAVPADHAAAAAAGGFTAALGQTLPLLGETGGPVFLLGLGDGAQPEEAGAAAAAALWDRTRITIDGRGLPRSLSVPVALGAALRAWAPPQLRQGRRESEPGQSETLHLDLLVDDPERIGRRFRAAEAALEAVCFARWLIATPSNLLTPKVFGAQIKTLEAAGLTVEILSGRALATQGFGLLQAVGRGSVNPPQLAVLRWAGRLAEPPVCFVGKGITFDTGGISIKPADRMWEMRGDMAGAAACVGAILALARRNSPAPAVAVLALAENMVGADSYRPGDVIQGHAGLTVEIVDTDAEGRLVLADALSYAVSRFRPRAVIDLATLTYAVGVALGHEMAGVYGNDDLLAAHLAAAGVAVGERVWPMPVTPAQREQLVSDIADIKQCLTGPLVPDASLAAAFLGRFVGETPWAHIDIGAVDAREEAEGRYPAGPTAFGVRLLDQLVAARYEDPDHP